MVLSKIDSTINYIETNGVDKDDIDSEAYIYTANIFNKKIKFVLGKPIFQYIQNNIVYFNIYLVNNETIISKIGVYETKNNIYTTLLDSEGDIKLSKLDNPRIFSFTKALIKTKYVLDSDIVEDKEDTDSQEESDDEITEFEDSEDEESQDDEIDYKKKKLDSEILEQTKEEAYLEIKSYKKSLTDKWINNFMKSNKYDMVDNEGGGDCFFAVLRDAYKTIDKNITVKEIREKLAEEVDEEVFQNHKMLFDAYYGGMKKSKEKQIEFKKRHLMIKKMIGGTVDGTDKTKLIQDAKINLQNLSDSSDVSKEYDELVEEMEFMKDISTLEEFKEFIKTKNFWANVWAISTIERIYSVKFIILSNLHYEENEIDNVLQCGEVDKKIQEKGIFEPEYYIITDYKMGEHYKLITYDKNINKGVFKFIELPYKIKELILLKCLEKCSGPYSMIPEFRDFANCNNVPVENKESKYESLVDETLPQQYNNKVVIQIYNKSIDKKVGDGSGEKIEPELRTNVNIVKLNKIKDWRKKLDDDYIVPNLIIDGNKWSSVKHFMLASRFNNIDSVYKKFTKKEENIGNNVANAQELYNKLLKDKSIKSDLKKAEIYEKELSKLLEKALYNKFSQNDELKNILLLTSDYKINIFKPGKGGGANEAVELMKVRELLGN